MQINDTVIYTELGKDHVATVLDIRYLDHHQGKNDEPLLHLGYFAPVYKAGPNNEPVLQKLVGTHDQVSLVQFRLDVAHESHEFSPEANKAGFKGTYPGGRWKYASVSNAEDEDQPVLASESSESTELDPSIPSLPASTDSESEDSGEEPSDPSSEDPTPEVVN